MCVRLAAEAARERAERALAEAITEADVAALLRTASARLGGADAPSPAALRERLVRLVRQALPSSSS